MITPLSIGIDARELGGGRPASAAISASCCALAARPTRPARLRAVHARTLAVTADTGRRGARLHWQSRRRRPRHAVGAARPAARGAGRRRTCSSRRRYTAPLALRLPASLSHPRRVVRGPSRMVRPREGARRRLLTRWRRGAPQVVLT